MTTDSSAPCNQQYSPYVLKCDDDAEITVPGAVVKYLRILRSIQDSYSNLDVTAPIVLQPVDSAALTKIIEYYTTREGSWEEAGTGFSEEDKALLFDGEDYKKLTALVMTADFLQAEEVLDVACKIFAKFMNKKSVPELREILMVDNDWTTEEYEKVLKENTWCPEHNEVAEPNDMDSQVAEEMNGLRISGEEVEE